MMAEYFRKRLEPDRRRTSTILGQIYHVLDNERGNCPVDLEERRRIGEYLRGKIFELGKCLSNRDPRSIKVNNAYRKSRFYLNERTIETRLLERV